MQTSAQPNAAETLSTENNADDVSPGKETDSASADDVTIRDVVDYMDMIRRMQSDHRDVQTVKDTPGNGQDGNPDGYG